MISQSYDLNMIPGGVQIRVPTSQYDAAGSRTLLFNLYYGRDGFGTVFTIPSGAAVYLDGTKPDGKSFRYTMTIVSGSTNQVSVDIDEQMTAVKGEVLCQVTIEKNEEILGSANFILDVEEAALKEGSDMSESIIAHIIALVEEAGAAAALAKRSAEEAEQRLAALGTLSSLTTDAKSNLVAAINEVDSHTDSNTTALGTLSSLTTDAKSNLVAAINEVDSHTDSNTTAISLLNSKFSSFLPDGTNIDNWDTTGFWLYQRTSPRSHTGTFPYSDSYGTLIHVQGTSTNVAMQMIRSNSIGKSYSTLYVRFKDSTWGRWFTFEDNALKSGNISVTSGWTVQNNNNWCRKSGHVAEFYLEVTGGTYASGWNALGTLPSGFTPLFTVNIVGIDNGSTGVPACQVQVQSNGVINVYKNSTLTNNLRIFGVYLVA